MIVLSGKFASYPKGSFTAHGLGVQSRQLRLCFFSKTQRSKPVLLEDLVPGLPCFSLLLHLQVSLLLLTPASLAEGLPPLFTHCPLGQSCYHPELPTPQLQSFRTLEPFCSDLCFITYMLLQPIFIILLFNSTNQTYNHDYVLSRFLFASLVSVLTGKVIDLWCAKQLKVFNDFTSSRRLLLV